MIHAASTFIEVDGSGRAYPMPDPSALATAFPYFARSIRRDSKTGRTNTHAESLRRLDAHFTQCAGQRADSYDGNAGLFSPRDLTHKLRRVLEGPLPVLNSRLAFGVNTEIPAGSKRYEQSRFSGTGQAVVYRGGSGQDVVDVGLAQHTVSAPVLYMVAAASMDMMEEMSVNLTGIDVNGRKLTRARTAIMQLQNKWLWEGAPNFGLFGVLNHPYIDTAISQVQYVYGTVPADMLADLYYFADLADSQSGGVFRSDRLLISNKLHNFLTSTIIPDTMGSNLLEMFLRHKKHITSVLPVRELDDVGGPGVHSFIFTRGGASSADASGEIMSVMEPTMLPAQQGALSSKIFMLAGFGGFNATEVGSMVIVYVNGVA